jgi:hypothetical protein
MAQEVIRIVEEVGDRLPPLIENRIFADKEVRGPAVLCPLDPNCGFSECTFAESADAIFLDVPKGKEIVGIIGLRNVRFVRCQIAGIGLVVTPDERNTMFGNGNPTG